MRGPFNDPQILWFRGSLKETLGLSERGMQIAITRHDQNRGAQGG